MPELKFRPPGAAICGGLRWNKTARDRRFEKTQEARLGRRPLHILAYFMDSAMARSLFTVFQLRPVPVVFRARSMAGQDILGRPIPFGK
jgi:hypothetical protein